MQDVEIVKNFENHEQRIKRAEERINTLEQVQSQIQNLTISVHDLSKSVEKMVREMSEVSTRVEAIEREPAQKWKDATKTITACVITAIVAFVLAKIGL